MDNVYLWKVGDFVIHHTDLEAAAQLDGLSQPPDKTVTDAQFAAAGSLARVINGKIVLGQTLQEQADDEARKRIAEIDERFEEVTRKMVRPMLAHIKGNPTEGDRLKLNELDAEAQTLRQERAKQSELLRLPY